MNMIAFLKAYGTDEACRAHMESVRWPNGPSCPKCGSVNEAGVVGNRAGLFRCRPCGTQFTVTVGTAMDGTHLPLRHWYLAMYLMLSTAKPISAMSLSRQMGIQYRTCWHLLHRLRAMLAGGEKLPLAGLVEADETYVGGKATNRQAHRAPGKRGRGTDKPMLFAAIERGGDARSLVVPSASSAAIAPALWDWTRGAATLLTDELATYRWIGRKMEAHHAVNHGDKEYAHTEGAIRVHTNTAEGFFGLFKRGIFGIHHQVSPKHLHRYAAEHTFRYNGRKHDAAERIARCLIGRHGRLRLRELFA
jgi:transposase-like protein